MRIWSLTLALRTGPAFLPPSGLPLDDYMNPLNLGSFCSFQLQLIDPSMLKQAVLQPSLAFFPRLPVLSAAGTSAVVPFSQQRRRRWWGSRRQNGNSNKVRCACAADESATGMTPPTLATATKRPATVKAVVTVLVTVGGVFAHVDITRGLDDFGDLFGRSLRLELVSATLDPRNRFDNKSINPTLNDRSI